MTRDTAIALLADDDIAKLHSEPRDPMAALYLPLLRLSARAAYVGVLSSFLETRLAALGEQAKVEGAGEVLRPCACCRYRTLQSDGYDVCPVCFWEDVGAITLDQHGGPNHLTLREAQRNFELFGAMDAGSLRHVLPDGPARYARAP